MENSTRGPGRPRVAPALSRRTYGISLSESTISKLRALASNGQAAIGEIVDDLVDREYSRRRRDAAKAADGGSPRRGAATPEEIELAIDELREHAKRSPQLGGAPTVVQHLRDVVLARDRGAASEVLGLAYMTRVSGDWMSIPFSLNVFERLIHEVEGIARGA